jgi:hypothetical protein
VRAAQDLGKLIRNHIHNDKVTDVTVKTRGSELKLSGHLKKAIPVHFEITGPISVTQNGLIDLHESSMKVVFKAEDTRLHRFVASSSCRTRLPVTRRHSPAFSLTVSVKKTHSVFVLSRAYCGLSRAYCACNILYL